MNLNLVRDILRRMETTAGDGGAASLRFDEHAQALVSQHLQLLQEAGLIDDAPTALGGGGAGSKRLTVKGREFLRLAKNDVLWKRVMGELASGRRTPTLAALNARMLEWSFMS